MNSVRLIGLIASIHSDLVINGFLITSRFARTCDGFFIPTSVDRTDLAGTDLMSCRWRAAKLYTPGTATLERGMFVHMPWLRACENTMFTFSSVATETNCYVFVTPSLFSHAWYGSTKASGIRILQGT